MSKLERKNIAEIEGLNQRGGRTLSFVDLIEAGTMSAEMVAHCWAAIARGASFLTAARPGGAGKSTVLANLLALLPPGEEIVTVTQARADGDTPRCFLAHEIGSGHWYGYIWGRQVAEFFARMAAGNRIASCIHADTLDELRDILLAPPLQVPAAHLDLLDLILFVHVTPAGRRVAALWERAERGHRLAFEWEAGGDCITRLGPSPLLERLGTGEAEYADKLALVRSMMDEGEAELAAVRARVRAAYDA